MDEHIKFYNLPHEICSCRDSNNRPTRISRYYREYYKKLKNGNSAIKILNDINVLRMCCRKKFMCIPVVPMIDRSEDRYYNDTKTKTFRENTRNLKSKKEPPSLPILTF